MIAQSQPVDNTVVNTIQLLITDSLLQTAEPESGLVLRKTFTSWQELFSFLVGIQIPIEQRGLFNIEYFEQVAFLSRALIDGQNTTCKLEIVAGGVA